MRVAFRGQLTKTVLLLTKQSHWPPEKTFIRVLKELEVEGAQVTILKALDNRLRASFTFWGKLSQIYFLG